MLFEVTGKLSTGQFSKDNLVWTIEYRQQAVDQGRIRVAHLCMERVELEEQSWHYLECTISKPSFSSFKIWKEIIASNNKNPA
jgi:hypothetical protein